MFSGIFIFRNLWSIYTDSEGHTVLPYTVSRISAGFHQRFHQSILAGNQVLMPRAIGSVVIADQVAVLVCLNTRSIKRLSSTSAGIDVKYNILKFFTSIRSYSGSQISGGFAQIDETVHHAISGYCSYVRKG